MPIKDKVKEKEKKIVINGYGLLLWDGRKGNMTYFYGLREIPFMIKMNQDIYS